MMTILTVALQEFDETLGDVIVELDARTLINAFTRTMKDLALQAVRRDSAAQDWLETRVAKLVTPAAGEDGGSGNSRP